jgi:hypothetical protein
LFKSNHKERFGLVVGAALLLAAVAAASVAVYPQQPAKPQLPFSQTEELVYLAEFNRSLLRGVNVGELRFSAKPSSVSTSGEGVWDIAGDATAKGFLLKLFGAKYRLHVDSVVNGDSFTVLHTKKVEEDRGRVRTSEAAFDHATRKVTWTDYGQDQSKPIGSTTVDFVEPIQDVLTVLYFVRTQKLRPGQTFDVPLVDNGRVYRCSVKVMERKKIKTVVGRVDTVRVEPAIFGDDRVIRTRGTLSIWVTDDARRLPVKAQVKIPAGTFDIKLKRVNYRQNDVAR